MLGYASKALASSLQLFFSLHFLYARASRSARGEQLKVFSGNSWACAQHYVCMWFSRSSGICQNSLKPRLETSFPSVSYLVFWLASCQPNWYHHLRQLRCSIAANWGGGGRGTNLGEENRVSSAPAHIKTNSENGAFQGANRVQTVTVLWGRDLGGAPNPFCSLWWLLGCCFLQLPQL